MKGSFESNDDGGGWVHIHMSLHDAKSLSDELFYTIDYRDEEYVDYACLKDAIDQAIREAGDLA